MTKAAAIETIKNLIREAHGENVKDENVGAWTRGSKHVFLPEPVPVTIVDYSRGHKNDPKYRYEESLNIEKLSWNRYQNRYYVSEDGGPSWTMSNLSKAELEEIIKRLS